MHQYATLIQKSICPDSIVSAQSEHARRVARCPPFEGKADISQRCRTIAIYEYVPWN
jgi:hypothetical protein